MLVVSVEDRGGRPKEPETIRYSFRCSAQDSLVPVGETVDGGFDSLLDAVDTVRNGGGRAVDAVGSDFPIKLERVEDAGAVLEVVGDDVDKVRIRHDILDQGSGWRALGVQGRPL